MTKKIDLNFEGKNFSITEGQKYNTNGNNRIKKILCIFDQNQDGQIVGDEFEYAQDYTAGSFGFSKNGKSVEYKEDAEIFDAQKYNTTTFDFDEKDRVTKRTINYSGGQDKSIDYFEWNDKNQLTKRSRDSDGDGTIDYTKTFEYDKNGNLAKEQNDYESDGKVDDTVNHKFNKKNLEVEKKTTHSDGTTDEVIKIEYDEQNRESKREFDVNGDGKVDIIIRYKYDKDGNQTEETNFNETKKYH